MIESLAAAAPAPAAAVPDRDPAEREAIVAEALAAVVAEQGSAFQPAPALYQDFLVRCRMLGLPGPALDLAGFRRRLAMARAGIDGEEGWAEALAAGAALPDEMLGPFLLIARAAREESDCPSDAALAELYGTSSLGRVRRLVSYMEEQGIIAARIDLSGRRSVSLPALGWTTAPAFPDPLQPSRLARPARRGQAR